MDGQDQQKKTAHEYGEYRKLGQPADTISGATADMFEVRPVGKAGSLKDGANVGPIHEGKTLIIVNPAAKSGKGARSAYHACCLLHEKLGVDAIDVIYSDYAGHATKLALGAAGTYTAVVTIGGDGAIHETVNGLMQVPADKRPVLGVIPVGTGNDYARTLGMSENVDKAVAQLIKAQPKSFDVGKVNDEYFVESLSFGLDAAIAIGTMERRKVSKRTGGALYFEVGIDQLLHHLNHHHIHAILDDDRVINTTGIMFAVQIGPSYGGGFRICPKADPADGLFDICYAEGSWSVLRAVAVFARTKYGKHTKAHGVQFAQASKLQLMFDEEPAAQADGEKIIDTSFDISMCPQALQVLVP